MSDERYCEPCKRLLCGKVQPYAESASRVCFTHHSDADSFKEALRQPCYICSFAWSGKEYPSSWQESISHGTDGVLFAETHNHAPAEVASLRFLYGSPQRSSNDISFVPYEDMFCPHVQFPSLLSDNTRSMSALNFLLSKYQECSIKHVGCSLKWPPITIYPSRLIYIGGLDDNLIYLYNMHDLNNQEIYTCLSYCWGSTQPLMLTNKTKIILQNGIPTSALPKTFQDAIIITRLLGIRFLWIDSLCIIQDNKADWLIEANHMGDIYNGAACTIAATAAKNSNGGLFFERDPTLLRPLRIEATWNQNLKNNGKFSYPQAGLYWCDFKELWTEAVERAPLNSRAWVCQERQLSPRILHFSDTQLFWECHEGTSCEYYPGGLPQWTAAEWFNDSSILKQFLYQLRLQEANIPSEGSNIRRDFKIYKTGPFLKHELYFPWAVFRIHYTQCALTKEEDKLIAIHGIAQKLGQILDDQLVAGLWYNHLLEELCWFKYAYLYDPPPYKPIKWRAPTWSWASSNARIWASNTTRDHQSCKNKQIWGEIMNIDVKAKASGELEHASLQIRCKPIPAIITFHPDSDNQTRYQAYGVLTFQNSMVDIQAQNSGSAAIDIVMDDLERDEICYVHMIVIQRCPHEEYEDNMDNDEEDDDEENDEDDENKDVYSDYSNCVEGLLLVPQHGCSDVFKRVGLFTATGSPTVAKVLKEYEAAESKIITLI